MTTTQVKLTAEEYKASLPKSRNGGIAWSMETFSVYVNLRYPHITVVDGQEWTSSKSKYKFICEKHGLYEAQATGLVRQRSLMSSSCPECRRKINSTALNEARLIRAKVQGPEIPKHLKLAARRASKAKYQRKRRATLKGKAEKCTDTSLRRLLKTNTPEYVFLDNQWMEVDRKYTYKVFNAVLLPADERKAIQELYLEAQYLTETTGIDHHVDHIQPLSKGGEHCMMNLQILTSEENLSKSGNFRLEDQKELARRLFQ